jgi:hypothetical protein
MQQQTLMVSLQWPFHHSRPPQIRLPLQQQHTWRRQQQHPRMIYQLMSAA